MPSIKKMKRKRRIFLILSYIFIFFQLVAYFQAFRTDVTEGETGGYLISFYIGYSAWLIAAIVLLFKANTLKKEIQEELQKGLIESLGMPEENKHQL
jgi:uncharacterized membrane protein (DUF485 family)